MNKFKTFLIKLKNFIIRTKYRLDNNINTIKEGLIYIVYLIKSLRIQIRTTYKLPNDNNEFNQYGKSIRLSNNTYYVYWKYNTVTHSHFVIFNMGKSLEIIYNYTTYNNTINHKEKASITEKEFNQHIKTIEKQYNIFIDIP